MALTLEDVPLSQFLEAVTQLDEKRRPVEKMEVGFPPKPINLKLDVVILKVGINNGDMVRVSFGSVPDIPYVQLVPNKSYILLRNIPDDNSCMFSAFLFGMGQVPVATVSELRYIVANHIKANADTYNEAVLGRDPLDYCKWIESKDAWGGAIELQILADWFQVVIHCVDVELANIILFESKHASMEMFLIYNGVHYDAVAENSHITISREQDIHQWPVGTSEVKDATIRLAKELQSKNYSTNLTRFRVQCLQCYKVFVGEGGAQKHASESGHVKFGEVKL